MAASKQQFSGAYKAKVALEAIKGEKTINQIASEYRVHPTQICAWKRQLIDQVPGLFADKRQRSSCPEGEALVAQLYQQIGQLKVELDFLKKKSGLLG